jgi:hypothetical protein
MFDLTKIKWNVVVFRDQQYFDPQMQVLVARDFYDRAQEKQRAETILRSPDSQRAVIVVGERRMGKSSLLQLLAHRLDLATLGQDQCTPLIIAWQGIHSLEDLCKEILRQIHWTLDLDFPGHPLLECDSVAKGISAIRNTLTVVPDKRIVLCIDEFDSVVLSADPHEKDKIIGLANEFVETADLPVKLLLSTAKELDKLINAYSSPLLTKSEQFRLHPFSEFDLDEMILDISGTEVSWTPHELEYIYELSGGWPYFAKLLLEYAVNVPIGEDRVGQALNHAVRHSTVDSTIVHIYEMHMDDHEKSILLLLAKCDGFMTGQEIAHLDSLGKNAIKQLVYRDYITSLPDGGCRFRIGLLKQWFSKWDRFELEVDTRLDGLSYSERVRNPSRDGTSVIFSVEPKRYDLLSEAQQKTRRSELRRVLVEFFNASELRDLCFDLEVDYDGLSGQGKGDKAREFVAFLERRGRIHELEIKCRELRPSVLSKRHFKLQS